MSALNLLGARDDAPAPRETTWAPTAAGVSLVAGAVGAALHSGHPVLGFVGGALVAGNAYAVGRGERSPGRAALSVGRHAAAHVAALACPSHPAAAYALTSVAAEFAARGAAGLLARRDQ